MRSSGVRSVKMSTSVRGGSRARHRAWRWPSADDFELQAAAGIRSARAHDGAQGAREAPLPSDHLAHVALGDVQPKDEAAVVSLDLLDAHRVRLVHEPARELREQLGHVTRCPWPS